MIIVSLLGVTHILYTNTSFLTFLSAEALWTKLVILIYNFSHGTNQAECFYTSRAVLFDKEIVSSIFDRNVAGAHLGEGRGEYSPALIFDPNFVPYFQKMCPILCPNFNSLALLP